MKIRQEQGATLRACLERTQETGRCLCLQKNAGYNEKPSTERYHPGNTNEGLAPCFQTTYPEPGIPNSLSPEKEQANLIDLRIQQAHHATVREQVGNKES